MKVPVLPFFYEQVHLGMRSTSTLGNCFEIAFTSKDRFCIRAVMGLVWLGTSENMPVPSCSEVQPQAAVWR